MEGLAMYSSDDEECRDSTPSKTQSNANNTNPSGTNATQKALDDEWTTFESMLGADVFAAQENTNLLAMKTADAQPPAIDLTGDDTKKVHSDSSVHSDSDSDSSNGRSPLRKKSDDRVKQSDSDSSSGEDPHHSPRKSNDSQRTVAIKSNTPPKTERRSDRSSVETPSPIREARRHESRKKRSRSPRSRRDSHSHRSSHRLKDKRSRRSRSRDRRSRSRGHKRSRRSRSRDRRSRSRDRRSRSRSPSRRHRHSRRHKRSRSRDGHRRRHSRSRSRDRRRRRRSERSRSHDRRRRSKSKERKPPRKTFKETMRAKLLGVAKEMDVEVAKPVTAPAPMAGEKPSDLPLNPTVQPLMNIQSIPGLQTLQTMPNIQQLQAMQSLRPTADGKITPQMALLQTMAVMQQKAQELTGVQVPKYYNPAAINPMKYAEQMQKRKLLWSKAKDNEEEKKLAWGGTQFDGDKGDKTTEKFRKLMGIKGEVAERVKENSDKAQELSNELHRKQDKLFEHLDKEYEMARMVTHTQRGVGFGFTSQTHVHSYMQQKPGQPQPTGSSTVTAPPQPPQQEKPT